MTDNISFDVRIYPPGSDHGWVYEVSLSRQELQIKGVGKRAVCAWNENGDHTWSGHGAFTGLNPLVQMLENDSIFPPSNLIGALEYAWVEWRTGNLSDKRAQSTVNQLFKWVNATTKSKPKSAFWKRFMC